MPKQERICIVGAGAAGLSAAHYLSQKGYKNIEILEASDRAGGKIQSFYYNGHPYDVGAIFLAHGYANVMRFVEHYGASLVEAPVHKIFYTHNGKSRKLVPGVIEMLNPRMMLSSIRWAKQFLRCRGLARSGFLEIPENAHLPISEFYLRHGVTHFERLAIPLFTCYGYGYADTESAAYQMKLSLLGFPSDLETLIRGIRLTMRRQPNGKRLKYLNFWRVKGGYESLFQTMAQHFPIRFNSAVTRLETKAGQVTLTCGRKKYTYDKVIFTIDPLILAKILGPDDPVANLMKQTQAVDYHSIVCDVENVETKTVKIMADNLNPDRRGHIVTICQTEPPDNICVAYVIGGPDISKEDIEEKIAKDFADTGANLVRILQHNKWRYSPNVPPDLMQTFFPTVEARQGTGNIYYGGEIMSYGTVETVCEYSRCLVKRFF